MSAIFTKRNIGVLLFCLIALGAAYWFLLRPAQAELEGLRQAATSSESVAMRLRQELANAEGGSDALLDLFNQIERVDAVIPLVDNETRIQLWTELPQLPSLAGGLTDVQASAPTNYANDTGLLHHIDINYTVKGSYDAILDLVDLIHNYPVLLTIESMSMQRDGESDIWSSALSVRAWAWSDITSRAAVDDSVSVPATEEDSEAVDMGMETDDESAPPTSVVDDAADDTTP